MENRKWAAENLYTEILISQTNQEELRMSLIIISISIFKEIFFIGVLDAGILLWPRNAATKQHHLWQ